MSPAFQSSIAAAAAPANVRPSMLHQKHLVMLNDPLERRSSGGVIACASLHEAEKVPSLYEMPVVDADRNGALHSHRHTFKGRNQVCRAQRSRVQ